MCHGYGRGAGLRVSFSRPIRKAPTRVEFSSRGRANRLAVGVLAAACAATAVVGCSAKPTTNAQLGVSTAGLASIVTPSPTMTPTPTPVSRPAPQVIARPARVAAPVYVPPPSGALPPATPATIAFPAASPIVVYSSPSTSSDKEELSPTSLYGSQRVFLVVEHRPGWTQILLPSKPNGRRAWMKADDLAERVVSQRVDVFINQKRLVVRDHSSIISDTGVGVGKPSTPTPTGTFYITDITAPRDTSGPYGPRAFGTSAYSDALDSFDGQAPQIAMHGTNHPELIPGRVSNGCLRLLNSTVRQLMPVLQLGTPVYIHP